MNEKIELKLAENDNDIQRIYNLAKKIWNQYYIEIISQGQIDYMLDKFYSEKAIKNQMGEGQKFYFIQLNSEPIGYLAFSEIEKDMWFMNKFYLESDYQKFGYGTIVLKEWELMVSPKEVKLQVNRKNYKSINFYFKNGFKIHTVADFDIGNGYFMDDFIMVKSCKE